MFTTPIPGATGAELTLPVTTAADDADFRCVVSNSRGSAPSAAVHLTLLEPIPGSVYRETDLPAGPDDEVEVLEHVKTPLALRVGAGDVLQLEGWRDGVHS